VFQVKFIAAAAGLVLLSVAPASAQMNKSTMPMPKGSTMPMSNEKMGSSGMVSGQMAMSKADMSTMKHCHKMSHKAMMKSRRCSAMMKSHSDMMMQSGKMGH
jgi:hypothetical protein